MKKILSPPPILSILSILCMTWSPLTPAADVSRRDDVLRLLQGYEWRIDATAFDHLGDDAFEVLLGIAEDPDVPGLFRERAFAALTLYPNDLVWRYFVTELEASRATVRRRRVVEALCQAFGDSRMAELEDLLLPYLDVRDAHLRTKVAKCLQHSTDTRVNEALDRYRSRIAEPWEARAAGFDLEQTR